MSWSVYLTINTGAEERKVVDIGNYTYNVSPMYMKAMGITISDLDGKKCSEVIPILRKGVLHMTENPRIHKAMNPPNGWGKYETALEFLEMIYKECINNPKCKIEVC
ncbi:hypothetical protein KAX02_00485 [candidate division WOR-3 bacterium]|nr:hypothetical protein [candidate division WOR-3 bacterium]